MLPSRVQGAKCAQLQCDQIFKSFFLNKCSNKSIPNIEELFCNFEKPLVKTKLTSLLFWATFGKFRATFIS